MRPPDSKKALPVKPADASPDHVALTPSEPAASLAAVPPPAVTAPPGLGTMLHALRRCCLWAVPLALLVGLVASAISWLVYPGPYTSTIIFRIQPRGATVSQEDEGHFSNVQRAYSSFLKSHEVLDEALRESKAAQKYGVNETPQTLAKKLTVTFNDGPEIMNVQLSLENPEASAAILNKLGEVFPRKVKQLEDERLKGRIEVLRAWLGGDKPRSDAEKARAKGDKPASTLAEQLRDKRFELLEAEKDAGLDDTTVKSKLRSAEEAESRVQNRLTDARAQLSSARGKVEGIALPRKVRPEQATPGEVDDQLVNNQPYQKALKEVERIARLLDYYEREYRPGTAAYENAVEGLPEALQSWRAEVRRLRRNAEQRVQSTLNKRARDKQETEDEAYEKEVNRAKAAVVGLLKEVEDLEKDLLVRKRELEEAQANRTAVTPKIKALRDDEKQLMHALDVASGEITTMEHLLSQPSRIERRGEAFAPTERDTSRSLKIALGIGVLVALSLLGGLCLLEATGRRVYSSGDVLQGLGLRILGTLPRLPPAARGKAAIAQALGGLEQRPGMNEAVDALRTVLMHAPHQDGARVVLISSALGGEGKTTLASHLAASLSRAWRKTLLIDGDLRKPALHEQFDLPLEPGFSEALRGEIEFDDAIKPTMTSRLWLLPAGKVDGHSIQALAQEALAGIFEQLKERYDFIVIDTSPVLMVPDGLLLAKLADTVLLSLMRDHSRIPAVYAAQQKLASLGIAVLGGVMIGEKTEGYGHAVPYPKKA
jgi:capsular exopolysaccharide synthesis family protein